MSRIRIGMSFLAVAALVIALHPTGAASQTTPVADDVAYQAIVKHDWATAEQQLLAGLQKDPDNSFRRLNLAWVYAQTGRKTEAAALYREILQRDKDRVATLSSRDGTSVAKLAERGLVLLNQN
jgi:Tfp pilus assembly protein PilF